MDHYCYFPNLTFTVISIPNCLSIFTFVVKVCMYAPHKGQVALRETKTIMKSRQKAAMHYSTMGVWQTLPKYVGFGFLSKTKQLGSEETKSSFFKIQENSSNMKSISAKHWQTAVANKDRLNLTSRVVKNPCSILPIAVKPLIKQLCSSVSNAYLL